MTTLDWEKFWKVIHLLGSNHDGEVLAAVHHADAMLRAAKLSWSELGRGQYLEFATEAAYRRGVAAEREGRHAAEGRAILAEQRLVEAGVRREVEARQATQREADLERRLQQIQADRAAEERRRREREDNEWYREKRRRAAVKQRNEQLAAVRAECDTLRTRQTPQQRRAAVLELLGDPGLSDREVARRVGVSPQTVGNLRRRQRSTRSETGAGSAPSNLDGIGPTPSNLGGVALAPRDHAI